MMQLEATDTKHIATVHESIIQNAKIFTYEIGNGIPVLFLHGSPDTHDMWLPLIARLKGIRAFATDLPGFGASTLPDDFSLSLDNMADFIFELLQQLGIHEPITLVTTDFGGHYGLAFTAKYPQQVRGIAISNTNFFPDYSWHFFAKLYRLPVVGEILLGTATRSTLTSTLKQVSPSLPDSYIDASYDKGFGSKRVRKTILRMYRERDAKDFHGWDTRLLTALPNIPAIVLWGDKDPFITPDYADRFTSAQVHHFEDYSHWLPLEAPQAYADVLMPWLKSI